MKPVDIVTRSARNAADSAGLNSHIRGEIHRHNQAAIIMPVTLQRVLARPREEGRGKTYYSYGREPPSVQARFHGFTNTSRTLHLLYLSIENEGPPSSLPSTVRTGVCVRFVASGLRYSRVFLRLECAQRTALRSRRATRAVHDLSETCTPIPATTPFLLPAQEGSWLLGVISAQVCFSLSRMGGPDEHRQAAPFECFHEHPLKQPRGDDNDGGKARELQNKALLLVSKRTYLLLQCPYITSKNVILQTTIRESRDAHCRRHRKLGSQI